MKLDKRPKAGPLQPLKILTRKWAQVTTDIVTCLSESNSFTTVTVFEDGLTKMVHFAPCRREVTAVEYAKLFFDTLFHFHGMPEVILSDRHPRFVGGFGERLFDLLGMDLRFNTPF